VSLLAFANWSFPCRDPLGAMPTLSAAHELTAPRPPRVNDAKAVVAASAAAKAAILLSWVSSPN